MIIEFINGCLPWKQIHDKHLIASAKLDFHKTRNQIENFNKNFHNVLDHIESLKNFRDNPDYELILDQLKIIQLQNNIKENDLFDWEVKQKSFFSFSNTSNVKSKLKLRKESKILRESPKFEISEL